MKTLSATPRPYDRWKAEDLSFLHVLLVWWVALTGLLIKKRQSWALASVEVSILFDGIVKKNMPGKLFFVFAKIRVPLVCTYVYCTKWSRNISLIHVKVR
jgi:hypothetical protein